MMRTPRAIWGLGWYPLEGVLVFEVEGHRARAGRGCHGQVKPGLGIGG